LYVETTSAAGNLAGVAEYSQPEFYGYHIMAGGSDVEAGVHFVFEYEAQEIGETDLKLYSDLTNLVDSVHIKVIPATMGTAFTYQGHLIEANGPADGLHDFEFKVYDANFAGTQKGDTIDVNALDVVDGYFTVLLDFGGKVFDGDARWLEISVRQSGTGDPFTILSPRQELTLTPYALYALQTSGLLVFEGNTFVGNDAGTSNTTGICNTFSGWAAGFNNTTGTYNTFSGGAAGFNNTTGYCNTFSGYMAGWYNTTGSWNTFIGEYAGLSNTTANYNTFSGSEAGYSNTTGSSNTFSGRKAGYSNTTGNCNTFSGDMTGFFNTTGTSNTFSGAQAGFNNTIGHDNTFSGGAAGFNNTTGNSNTFSGVEAGRSNTEGNYNTFLGKAAGYYNTTGNGNVFIGYRAGYSETGSNKLYIANSDVTMPLIYGDFSTGSVGIGTTSPGAKLDVNGSIIAAGGNSTNWNTAFGWGNHALAGYLKTETDPQVGSNTINRIPKWDGAALVSGTIYDNGNVGIGTSVTSDRKLRVYTNSDTYGIEIYNDKTSGTNVGVCALAYGDTTGDSYGVWGVSSSDAGRNYGVRGSASGNTTDDSYGVLGISSSASGNNFGVSGHAREPSSGTNYGVYGIADNSGTGDAYAVYGDAREPSSGTNYGVYGIATNSGGGVAYAGYFSGISCFIGNVGIGTTSPTDTLDINGTARVRTLPAGGGTPVVADPDGKLLKASSSQRYKTNIESLDADTDAVLNLRPVRFQWKTTGQEDIGLIAEEVEQQLSDLVIYDNQGRPDGVKYDKVALHLLGVVKAQQEKIAELEKRLETLENTTQQIKTAKEVQQ
jgi:hypothetical protein